MIMPAECLRRDGGTTFVRENGDTGYPSSAHSIWLGCLEIMKTRVNSQSFKTWFEPVVPLRFEKKIFSIQVPSQFFCDWLEEHYFSLINEALAQVTGFELLVEYAISPDDREIPTTDQREDR